MDNFSKWLNGEKTKATFQGMKAGLKGNTKEYQQMREREQTLSKVIAEYEKFLKLNVAP